MFSRSIATLAALGLAAPLALAPLPAGATDAIISFQTLGKGGCRTPKGGAGRYSLHGGVSERQCLSLCSVGRTPCTAVEYNARKRECEVHWWEITRLSAAASGDTTCYVVRR